MLIINTAKPPSFPGLRIYRSVKPRDQSKVSDSTLADDPDFGLRLDSNKFIRYEGKLFYKTGAAEDFKFMHGIVGTVSVSSGAEQNQFILHKAQGATVYTMSSTDNANFGSVQTLSGGAGYGHVKILGVIRMRRAGRVFLQWAQATSGATPTILLAGSYIEYTEVPNP